MLPADVTIRELPLRDSPWSDALARLPDAPSRLFVAGALPALDRAVAIVGTRAADDDALDFAHDLAADLGRAGCVIVSGGARGIDAAAHEGALAVGAPTLAVLATGFGRPYPPEHRDLFTRIARAGALVSEHEDVQPHGGRFLQRNRLVAALATVVVVAQAPLRSGAMSTAAWAGRLEKPVLAVPYAPWDPRGAGCLALLARGSRVCTRARDVLSVAAPEPGGLVPRAGDDTENGNDYADLDADGRRTLHAVGGRTRHVDEIARRAAIPVQRVQRALLTLLLLGLIEERGVGRYARCGRRRT